MKSFITLFVVFALISVAPITAAVRTTEVQRQIYIGPGEDAQVKLNIANVSNQQYTNKNVSIDPFKNASGVDGITLSSVAAPVIFTLSNATTKDNNPFIITSYYQLKASTIMSGASISWWRVPYYYNIDDITEEYTLKLTIYRVTTYASADIDYTYDPPRPLITYQPSLVFTRNYSSVGYHNDSATWYTKTAVNFTNQIQETDDVYTPEADYLLQDYQFTWVNVTAPIYAGVGYVAIWQIWHSAADNVDGDGGSFYVTQSDICEDNVYKCQVKWGATPADIYVTDADASIIFMTGMAGSTTGYKIQNATAVTDITQNAGFEYDELGSPVLANDFPSIAGWTSAATGTGLVNPNPDFCEMNTGSNPAFPGSYALIYRNDYIHLLGDTDYTLLLRVTFPELHYAPSFAYIVFEPGGYGPGIIIQFYSSEMHIFDNSLVPITYPISTVLGQYYQMMFVVHNSTNQIEFYREPYSKTTADMHFTQESYITTFTLPSLPINVTSHIEFGCIQFFTSIIRSRMIVDSVNLYSNTVESGREVTNWSDGYLGTGEPTPPSSIYHMATWESQYSPPATPDASAHELGIYSYTNRNEKSEQIYNNPIGIGTTVIFQISYLTNWTSTLYATNNLVGLFIVGYSGGAWNILSYRMYGETLGSWRTESVSVLLAASYSKFSFAIITNHSTVPLPGYPLWYFFDNARITTMIGVNEIKFCVPFDSSKVNATNYLTLMVPFKFEYAPFTAPWMIIEFDDNAGTIKYTESTGVDNFYNDFILISIRSNTITDYAQVTNIWIRVFCPSEAYLFLYDYNKNFDKIGVDPQPYTSGLNRMYIINSTSLIIDELYFFEPYHSVQFTEGQWVNSIDTFTTQYVWIMVTRFYAFMMDQPVLLRVMVEESDNPTAYEYKLRAFGDVYDKESWYAYVAARNRTILASIYHFFNGIYLWIRNGIAWFMDMFAPLVVSFLEDMMYALLNVATFVFGILTFVIATYVMWNFVLIWIKLPIVPLSETIRHIQAMGSTYTKTIVAVAGKVGGALSSVTRLGK